MYKSFCHALQAFIDILEKNGSIEEMYSALQSDDLADGVTTALHIVNNTQQFDVNKFFRRKVKCEQKSYAYRLKGNQELQNQSYRNTLICYNLALLFAPTNTESMILALSNRSQLLLQVGAIDECLRDIERCQTLECSGEIKRKLEARKAKCRDSISINKFDTVDYKYPREYFKFDVRRNKDIPCVSDDVSVVQENGVTKIVAARDIEVGKVVAIEPAFVAALDHDGCNFISCYYCHKMSLNLIPCKGCCVALFCDENCLKLCFRNYHHIECQVIDIIECIGNAKLPIVAALKIWNMSDSWDDFISLSLEAGQMGMKEISLKEIYDHNNKRSLLNFNNDKHFLYGKMFNACFSYAVIIKYLSDIPDYLPGDVMKRTKAQHALARIMLFLRVKFPILRIHNSRLSKSDKILGIEPYPNIGLFSFASKLTHRCSPNLFSVGLGNNLALIAVKSIKRGTELTVSHLGHWCDIFHKDRATTLFAVAEMRCQCRVCVEDWNPNKPNPVRLSIEQIRHYNNFVSNTSLYRSSQVITWNQFKETCRALKVFQNFSNTREYIDIFKTFHTHIIMFQYLSTLNTTLHDTIIL